MTSSLTGTICKALEVPTVRCTVSSKPFSDEFDMEGLKAKILYQNDE